VQSSTPRYNVDRSGGHCKRESRCTRWESDKSPIRSGNWGGADQAEFVNAWLKWDDFNSVFQNHDTAALHDLLSRWKPDGRPALGGLTPHCPCLSFTCLVRYAWLPAALKLWLRSFICENILFFSWTLGTILFYWVSPSPLTIHPPQSVPFNTSNLQTFWMVT